MITQPLSSNQLVSSPFHVLSSVSSSGYGSTGEKNLEQSLKATEKYHSYTAPEKRKDNHTHDIRSPKDCRMGSDELPDRVLEVEYPSIVAHHHEDQYTHEESGESNKEGQNGDELIDLVHRVFEFLQA